VKNRSWLSAFNSVRIIARPSLRTQDPSVDLCGISL
jgi:hypothetical protein